MKGHKNFYWGISFLVIILLAGCGASTGKSVKASLPAQAAPERSSEDILARVGERTITVSGFDEKFNALPPEHRQGGKEQKIKALEQLVEITLFSLEARAQKIDKEESVERTILDVVDNILAREYYNREILPETTVTNDEIKNYYDSHPDEFKDSKKVKARHILVGVEPDATQKEWDAALKKAKNLKKEIDNGADFAKLAKDKSDDGRTKGRGGVLWRRTGSNSGYMTRENIPAGFPDILFSLNAGQISEPVKGAKGYHIIKVEAKRPEKIRTLDQVEINLKRKLTEEKQKVFFAQTIERLKEKYNIVINADLFSLGFAQK